MSERVVTSNGLNRISCPRGTPGADGIGGSDGATATIDNRFLFCKNCFTKYDAFPICQQCGGLDTIVLSDDEAKSLRRDMNIDNIIDFRN